MSESSEFENETRKSNREKLAEQLEKRNKERKQQLNTKHELSKQNAALDEDLDYFQATFRQHVNAIEDDLDNLKAGDKAQLAIDIKRIVEAAQQLQTYLTTSTLFLSNYNIKKCQSILNDLNARIDTTKEKLLAKKKFGFRAKADTTTAKNINAGDSLATKRAPLDSRDEPDDQQHHIDWTLQNRKYEEIILEPIDVNEKDITISSIDSCLIQIIGHPGSLQLSHLTNCVILCGPISRSVFADNCTNCKFAFGCQQLRLHSSHHCDLYMHVTCRAIIEDCNNINVAPYNHTYTNIDNDFVKAGLDLTKNNWEHVADFNWLSIDVQSPNWQQMKDSERITCWTQHLKEFRQKMLSQ